jgi:hypothetical protein
MGRVSNIREGDVRRAVEASRKARGANKFPSEMAIKAAFAAGAAAIEIVRPDGVKVTIRKDSDTAASATAAADEWDQEYGTDQTKVRLPATK